MADPFIGEIRLFPFTYAPQGWLYCDGATYPVQQYQALASILGKIYGGDGQTTFQVPNLQGLAPVGFGQGTGLSGYPLAQTGGTAQVTLDQTTIPTHDHTAYAAGAIATTSTPSNSDFFAVPNVTSSESWKAYHTFDSAGNLAPVNPAFLQPAPGGSTPHENRQPYLALAFCINYDGVYPVQQS